MKKFLNAVLFSIITILTLIGLFYSIPYIDNNTPIESFWIEVVLTPLIAVLIMTLIKHLLFKSSEATILTIGFGTPLIVLAGIGYHFRELPNNSIYRLDFIFMSILSISSFIFSCFVMAILLKKGKAKDNGD